MHPKRQQYKFLDMLKTLTDQPLRGNFTALQIEVLNYVAKNNVPEGTKFSGVPGHARYGSSSCTTLVVQNDDHTVEVNFSLNSNTSTPLPLCAKKVGINPKGEPKPTEPKPETQKIETKKDENMKKTITSRKQRKEQNILAYNISMALSKFTAIMMGEPDKYKTTNGGINYYPSDCLNYWNYSVIDSNGNTIDNPANAPEKVAGIRCKGNLHWNDEPQQITVLFKDL